MRDGGGRNQQVKRSLAGVPAALQQVNPEISSFSCSASTRPFQLLALARKPANRSP